MDSRSISFSRVTPFLDIDFLTSGVAPLQPAERAAALVRVIRDHVRVPPWATRPQVPASSPPAVSRRGGTVLKARSMSPPYILRVP